MNTSLRKGLIIGAIALAAIIVAVVIVNFKIKNYRAASLSGAVGYDASYQRNFAADTVALSESAAIGRIAAPSPIMPSGKDYAPVDLATNPDRLIIKTGYLSITVTDVPSAVQSVVRYATERGGFVVSSEISKSSLSPVATVVVRIPAKEFDGGVTETKKLGEVKSERVNGQDVTEEYVDLDAQLKNLRAGEQQYLVIMQRAMDIEDVLAVQRELTNIRGQIDGIEGRMKYLKQSASLSTLTVYLSTDSDALPVVNSEEQWKPIAVVKDALRSLIELGKGLVNVIIWLVIYIPLWGLVVLVGWLLYRWIRRLSKPCVNFKE